MLIMTSKEDLKMIKIKCHPNANPNPMIDEALNNIEKDLELLEKYKRVMCEPIKDIMKELKKLDYIKLLVSNYNNGKLGYINFTQEVIEVVVNG